MPTTVQRAFRRFTRENLGATFARLGLEARDGLFDALRDAYAEPHRAYHTAQHIEECLLHAELAGASPEIELALWFHDAIYDTRRHDNEERSAEWAMRECGLPQVASLILATRHVAIPQTPDEQLLVDIDLSIFGSDPDRFAEYDAQIREEYSWVPRPLYAIERAKVLRRFVERPSIFSTAFFRERLEERARKNLQQKL